MALVREQECTVTIRQINSQSLEDAKPVKTEEEEEDIFRVEATVHLGIHYFTQRDNTVDI